jgi:glutamyl-tRNA reductase
MNYGIIGTSIWQQNMPLLEKFTIDRASRRSDVVRLKKALGVDELVYLATCNRVEFIYASKTKVSSGKLLHRLIDFFLCGERDISFFPNDFYHFVGREALVHLFRTAASLESLVVGETQITGQIKQAHQDSIEYGTAGRFTSSLVQEALQVAKRVKRETSIGVGALSVASLAATELRDRLANAGNSVIALVGAGPMTAKMARYIVENGLGTLVFVNRTVAKAEALAQEFGFEARSITEFLSSPGTCDAIVSATAATEVVFDKTFLAKLPVREQPLICVDLAVPRDFGIEFSLDPRVFLIDIPYLKSRGNGNLRQKFVEASKANEIVRESVTKYLSDRVESALKPIFHDSYRESLELADRSLESLFATTLASLGEEERSAIKQAVVGLIGHSSFQPVKLLSDRLASANMDLAEPVPIRREAV